ncbi:alpha/beta fold hydrolase [Kutzneria kofuensis]|uniref:Pimeloyl-ACP methyl ester carboxylesterase n=1 Tax=Kutzneria kofuensis TaxID=103725 RepID=A0A7W9KET0_9PSEU|nr:alpha/beta fold hydrolase [Kutzneria kofuensis]MBB5890539.1 pimeloyl-ACP methyl ester carboxylesterase [Kutzneria kofuensis]
MRRLLPVALSLLAVVSLVTPARAERVVWAPCPGALECTTLSVPLDYAHPDQGAIAVVVSRRQAADPAHRKGVLLINPGGPGGSGLSMPRFIADHTPLGQFYDLVGFDPRGVGASTALRCLTPVGLAALDSRPGDDKFASWAADARESEDACSRAGGGIRPFINTRDTARDMDSIRAALGVEKINYLGYSYGTYLGAVYGTMFPDRLNLSVLDSSVHPEWIWRKQFLEQATAYRSDVDAWASWVGDRNGAFGLGVGRDAVLASVEQLARDLAKSPVGKFNRSVLDGTVGEGARYRPLWSDLAQVLVSVRKGSDPSVGDAVGAGLALAQRGLDAMQAGVFDTVTCEADWPSDLSTYYQDMRLFRDSFPYGYGVLRAAPTTCTYRSFTPVEAPVSLARNGYPVGVVVQAEGDTQTAYAGGPAMAQRLRDNLITVADEGAHGEYGSNPCVTEKINRYFVDGVLPDSSSVCAGSPRPDVPADAVPTPTGAVTLAQSVRSYLSGLGPF